MARRAPAEGDSKHGHLRCRSGRPGYLWQVRVVIRQAHLCSGCERAGKPLGRWQFEAPAEAHVSAADNINRTHGEIINIANPSTESVKEISRAALRAAGHPNGQVVFSPPTNRFEEMITWSLWLSTRKTVNLLGFGQKHPRVVDGIETYYRTWKALRG
ncbi:hypothetical protein BC938DRAFT_482633 [Jimgerdemannia flammicorona]|uniref:Uncharacterized protein n=1 Tax=Jimgerdemannia flammicorona TaxID=994334 RepID=A0A433QDK4_9FUNG|nr:hypothetical protein BC938DRAFT_482633 [Jimgerdemannia flammicorona]